MNCMSNGASWIWRSNGVSRISKIKSGNFRVVVTTSVPRRRGRAAHVAATTILPQRQLTMRDVADYEKASELYELRDMAREVQRQDRLKSQIEDLMLRDANAYFESGWPQVYSRLTGAVTKTPRV